MEFRQLRYFIAAAETGNIGTAAARLNVSQPPVSRQIQALEDELGVQLLIRTQKGVKTTAAGEAFLEDARRILGQTAQSRERCRAAGRGEIGTLEVGYFGSVIYQVLPMVLRRFLGAAPDARVNLHHMNKQRLTDAMRAGQIHVSFGRYFAPEPDLAIAKVQDESLYLAVSEERQEPPGRPVELGDFGQREFILFPKADRPSFADEVIGLLTAQGLQPRIGHVAEDASAALALTAMGAGVCIVPASLAAIRWPGVKFTPLAQDMAVSPIVCAHMRNDPSPILKRFLEVLAEFDDAHGS